NTRQGFTPPNGLANDPRPASLARIAKLGENAPCKHCKGEGERAPHQRAPVLVPCVSVMNANFISCLSRVVMADGNNRREKHLVASGRALQGIVRFFVHMIESSVKTGQLKISGSTQDRPRVCEGTRQILFRSEVRLRQRLRILV